MRPFTLKTNIVASDKASKAFNKITHSAARMNEKIIKSAGFAGTAFGRFTQKVGNSVRVATVHLNNLNARVNRTFRSMKQGFAAIGIVGVISGIAGKKILDLSNNVAKAGDEAAKNSRRIGFSAEALQELQFAADRSGISAQESLKSFEKLSKNIGDLVANTGSLYTILNKTNPQLLRQLKNAKSNEEAFNLITDAISKLPTDMQKASLAQAAFGRSGQKMLTLIEGGTKGVEALREEARKYGGVISNEAAKASEDFIDAQTNMKFALKGLTNQIGIALMPKIKELSERLTKWIGENKELIKAKVAAFVDKIGKAVDFLIRNAGTLITVIKILIGVFAGLKILTTIMRAVTAATWLFNSALWANPITWIVIAIIALIAAIALLIYYWKDIVNWIKTSDNWFAKLIRAAIFPLIIAFKTLGAIFDWISEKISQLIEWVKTSDNWFAKFLRGAINGLIYAFQIIGGVIDWVGSKFGELTEWIKTSDNWFAKFIRGAIDFSIKLVGFLKKIWNTIVEIVDYAFKAIGKLSEVIDYFSGETQKELGVKVTKESKAVKEVKQSIDVKTEDKKPGVIDKITSEAMNFTKALNDNSAAVDANTKSNQKQWKGKFQTTILKDMNIAQKDLAVNAVYNERNNQEIQNTIFKNKSLSTVISNQDVVDKNISANDKPTTEVVTSGKPIRRKDKQNINGIITVNVVDKTGGKFGIQVEGTGIEVVTTGNK